jgi:hypothetical protein
MLAGNSGTKTPMIMIKLKIATADFWMHWYESYDTIQSPTSRW